MREIIARIVCLGVTGVVIALSVVFAIAHNPKPTVSPPSNRSTVSAPRPPPAATVPLPAVPAEAVAPAMNDAARIEHGLRVYQEQNCAGCHAVGGSGNPRHPLDGVGARLPAAELAHWITGTGAAAESLSTATIKRKQRYQNLPPEDLRALVAYLSSLRG